ncbi:MAG: helix-turn-helix transcriptional regulator [Eubacterium sp.]|nr:helix-turn-helix transcriptional regulator [Eubacterium sp.]
MRIDSNEIIGNRIARFRKIKGYTQAELAEKIELSTTEISNLERGKNKLSYRALVGICKELDVCPCQLLTGAIKDTVEDNIVDLIRHLSKNEQQIVFQLLLTYTDNKNFKM